VFCHFFVTKTEAVNKAGKLIWQARAYAAPGKCLTEDGQG